MENISYVGLSQQIALRNQMNVVANNIANMSTPGFKTQNVLFLEYLNKPKDGTETVKQVLDYASYRDLSTGNLMQTHNKLDVAIQGDGYFVVETPEGLRYTRDGSFSLNNKNEIVNKSGFRLMNDSNNPIALPAEARDITILADGSVSTDQGAQGRIKVVTFENQQEMVERGQNLYDATQLQERPVENLKVVQGALEGANVNPVTEMNKMIEILRMYQATQRMLQNDHERIRGAIQKLTRV